MPSHGTGNVKTNEGQKADKRAEEEHAGVGNDKGHERLQRGSRSALPGKELSKVIPALLNVCLQPSGAG